MTIGPAPKRAPAVILDTMTWRRLAPNPAYLSKLRQLQRLDTENKIHLAVPEIVKEEFARRVPDIENAWKRSVKSFSDIPQVLLDHLGDSIELREIRDMMDEKV